MSMFRDYELFVITYSAPYVGMGMSGDEVYTNKDQALQAMATYLENNKSMVSSGFRYEVMALSDYIREYAQDKYNDGKHDERGSNYD